MSNELLKEEQLDLLQFLLMEVAMDRMEVTTGFAGEDGGYLVVEPKNE